MCLELPAKLGLATETPAKGDLRDGFLAPAGPQIVEGCVEPEHSDPVTDGSAAVLEQVVEVAHGDAIGARDLIDRHRRFCQISANVTFDARKVGEPHGTH